MSEIPATTRRAALIGSAAAVLAGGGAAAAGTVVAVPGAALADSGADVELLARCTRFHQVHAERLWWADPAHNVGMDDEAFEPIDNEWQELVDEITDTPARTPSGIIAKARVTQSVLRALGGSPDINASFEDTAEAEELIAMSLANDIVAIAGRLA